MGPKRIKRNYDLGVYRAGLKKQEFSLSLEEYTKIIKLPCSYCQLPLPEQGHGLDRIDNSKGYTIENVLPACGRCNVCRGILISVEDMKNIVGPAIRIAVLNARQKK